MPERESHTPSPEDLLHFKDEITRHWRQLPPEHQATMTLVLFQETLEGEYGSWLRSAVRVIDHPESDSPFRFLPIVRITKAHLDQANLSADEIARLDDEDLMSISHDIVRHYTNDVFWEELEFLVRKTLDEKQSE